MTALSDSEIKTRVRVIRRGSDAFGPGKAQLLESLIETASLNQSAIAMKMSYVKALALVRAMNEHFQEPLVELSRGGKHGGGARVTKTGLSVLGGYRAMCKASETAAKPGWRKLQKLLKT